MRAVLVGNQNAGKTTIFNALTGSNQKIGNWPGVTLERKSGIIHNTNIELIDLPGIYSLQPYSVEEKVSCDFLRKEKVDLIINVVDATSLERGLYLTLQLFSLSSPMIVLLNMADKLPQKGIRIDVIRLEKLLGVKVFLVSGAEERKWKSIIETCSSLHHLKNNDQQRGVIHSSPREIIELYHEIDRICHQCVRKTYRHSTRQEWLDKIFLHRFWAIPIFVLVILGMYFVSIEIFGKYFADLTNSFVDDGKAVVQFFLKKVGTSEWMISLIVDGVMTGVGSVLSFLPQLTIIFIGTSFLEASGYMARVAFMFDKILRKVGLNGKSLIPFLLGTGCSVSGIASTKIMEEEQEKIRTIVTVPFIPCSAKLPTITLFSQYFFPYRAAWIATSFYFLSVMIVIVSSLIMQKVMGKEEEELYLFEMPEYRLPSLKALGKDVRVKCQEFIRKAGTVIFLSSVLIWCLLSFSVQGEYGVSIEESLIAALGKKVSGFLVPVLGVDSWEATVSALQGIIAKEQIVSSMEIIRGFSNETSSVTNLFGPSSPFGFFGPASAYAYVALNLFTVPCIATIATMKRELTNGRYFYFAVFYEVMMGWIVAVLLRGVITWTLSW